MKGIELRMRTEDQIRHLRDQEGHIRASEFWRGKPKGAEAAVRRLYLTGAGDCGGSSWPSDASQDEIDARIAAERALERKFAAIWKRDPEQARSIDWQRLNEPERVAQGLSEKSKEGGQGGEQNGVERLPTCVRAN
ncbi:hypothetical protein [Mesorhizobium sp. M1342]|uniref:hypothetical protein n=1 Tax=Mesorhizobium sp. M1342 TaxID=2957088 RepID=UPI003336E332